MLRQALKLREKKIYFEQLLHIVTSVCGKVVDWISKAQYTLSVGDVTGPAITAVTLPIGIGGGKTLISARPR